MHNNAQPNYAGKIKAKTNSVAAKFKQISTPYYTPQAQGVSRIREFTSVAGVFTEHCMG